MKTMDNNELKEQIEYNTDTLKDTNKTANEIIDRNKMMNTELKRQGNVCIKNYIECSHLNIFILYLIRVSNL